jgi:phosphoglucosamine mutase
MNFFGTDGIRGTYGRTITDGTAFLLGKALALSSDQAIIVIARDTRVSGESLFNALVQGVYNGGGNAINLGILPTNSVGHFVRKLGGDYGVMISASHNPPSDNGLKVFDKYGIKLCRAKQNILSNTMNNLMRTVPNGKVYEPIFYDIENIYCDDLLDRVPVDMTGLKIALDCCFGASFKVAKMLFARCNAKVTAFCNTAKGKMINVGCGATNTDYLLGKMASGDFHLGFAFDGDCDRIAMFERATLVDNDRIFLAMAKYLCEKGKLSRDTVVGTILTNSGLEEALASHNINMLRSDVGDTNVMNLMCEYGLNLGGEDSGHFILSDFATSSDALLTALFLTKIYIEKGSILKYTAEYTAKPVRRFDIPLSRVSELYLDTCGLTALSERANKQFPHCRLILRTSGTEEKIRVNIEGENYEDVEKLVVATLVKGEE